MVRPPFLHEGGFYPHKAGLLAAGSWHARVFPLREQEWLAACAHTSRLQWRDRGLGRQDSTRWCVLARCLFPILPHTRAPGRGRLFGFDHLERGLSMGRCATIGMCSYNIPQRTAV